MKSSVLWLIFLTLPVEGFSQSDSLRGDSSNVQSTRGRLVYHNQHEFKRRQRHSPGVFDVRGGQFVRVGLVTSAVGTGMMGVALVGALASLPTLQSPGKWVEITMKTGKIVAIGGVAMAFIGLGITVYDLIQDRPPRRHNAFHGKIALIDSPAGFGPAKSVGICISF